MNTNKDKPAAPFGSVTGDLLNGDEQPRGGGMGRHPLDSCPFALISGVYCIATAQKVLGQNWKPVVGVDQQVRVPKISGQTGC